MSDRHFLLIYDLAPDYLERRPMYRGTHLAMAREALAHAGLVLAGPLADPVDQAFLLFKGAGPEAAEAFARADPYVTNGLVIAWKVRPWTTVIGPDALSAIT